MDQVPDAPAPTSAEQGDEQLLKPLDAPRPAPEIESASGSTGVESVDRVLVEVAAVADAPVEEHVQVFERAHEQLRRALDAQPEPANDGERGA